MNDRAGKSPVAFGELLAVLMVLAAASVSPLIFPIAEAGYSDMHWLGIHALVPAVAAVFAVIGLAGPAGWKALRKAILIGIWAGAVSTIGLEIVRTIGFRYFGAMPGSMPMLMGVLLTDRFMQGPNWLSNLIGWSDHFWNGASFAIIYILLLGRTRWWMGLIYAYAIATIFMLSPVMSAIGAGRFGQQFAPLGFPLTVYLAHTAYGFLLGWLVSRTAVNISPIWNRLHLSRRTRLAGPGAGLQKHNSL